jgi:acetyl-CoA synthetase
MEIAVTTDQLTSMGLTSQDAAQLIDQIHTQLQRCTEAEDAWRVISQQNLLSRHPFNIHLLIFTALFPNWHEQPETAPVWMPEGGLIKQANIAKWMAELTIPDVAAFHQWTVNHQEDFWRRIVDKLNIVFKNNPQQLCDLTQGAESPRWFPDAKLNIADSCFTAPSSATAIIYKSHEDAKKNSGKLTYGELKQLSNRIANSLLHQGFTAGDAIAIAMPMDEYAVAIYLGIIKMGGVVVSIADSFSSQEMAVRLNIAKTKGIFTQDRIHWDGKKLPLYEKVQHAIETDQVKAHSNARIKAIVLPCEETISLSLHENDIRWTDFLLDNPDFTSVSCDPMMACNILFSSGTTAEPKAIVWNHTTAIKAASDAYFHQNIQAGDVLAWPTNLGWMMGPWLLYAALINHATIALYPDAPKGRQFGEFIQRSKVTLLGVVPTLVAAWRKSHCMENLDWSTIKVFSSTGECSNPEDMFYLMSLAQYKPVIEYCGGTEIGGAYISSTVIEKNFPSLFTTPAMGSNFTIIDEHGKQANQGEVAIIPPAMGLSTQLLNADQYQVYYANMPKTVDGKPLRRHGDQIKKLPNGHYILLGRVDDTMNLGGIKISSVEIERAIAGLAQISDVAAIAVPPPDNGPSLLIIFAVTTAALDKQTVMKELQKKINTNLNPLFKIHDLVFMDELPKTASNKIMRRKLREKYLYP